MAPCVRVHESSPCWNRHSGLRFVRIHTAGSQGRLIFPLSLEAETNRENVKWAKKGLEWGIPANPTRVTGYWPACVGALKRECAGRRWRDRVGVIVGVGPAGEL